MRMYTDMYKYMHALSKLRNEIATHHVTKHNTPTHNIIWTVPRLSICQKALGTLPEDGNVVPKRIGDTIHN
jgi:hypothetical protein